MKLTLIHPAIGRRVGQRYIKTWQMEPLPPALIAGLTPPDVDIRFYDDRMEAIPYDETTDLVAISVETYTAKRAYQIASEYRSRGVPVVMGGFHATLCPEEVANHAESVVIGEAELIWPELIDDYRHGQARRFYRADSRPPLQALKYDRNIFRGKRYLPIGLVEAGRGCRFKCDFCAIQTVFSNSHNVRPVEDIVREIKTLGDQKNVFFFVDDNFAADIEKGKSLLKALIPLKIRWVTQMTINAAHDEEFLELLNRSGCKGVLIGFESLKQETLKSMRKDFNTMRGGYEVALNNLRRFNIRIYATFVFGYDGDNEETFQETLAFANANKFYISAFNHLTPFPGTPLYERLETENRLRFEKWWLDARYSYNQIPFLPSSISPEMLQQQCLETRREFYSWPNILHRGFDRVNRSDFFMFRNFFFINAMHRAEVQVRNHYPLGDAAWKQPILTVQ